LIRAGISHAAPPFGLANVDDPRPGHHPSLACAAAGASFGWQVRQRPWRFVAAVEFATAERAVRGWLQEGLTPPVVVIVEGWPLPGSRDLSA